MSYADQVFKKTCKDILSTGTDTSGAKVRPYWEDGTPAYTIKKFGVINEYVLRKEFPALKIREFFWFNSERENPVIKINSNQFIKKA